MANPITTVGTTTDPISTQRIGIEPTSTWVARHNAAVAAAKPAGNTLTTTWRSANGEQTKSTTRKDGESDVDFLLRHTTAYLLAMVEEPPIT